MAELTREHLIALALAGASRETLHRALQGHADLFGLPDPEPAMETLSTRAISAVTLLDSAYPVLLRQIPDPPVVLFYRGTLPPPDAFCLALVGTRRPSPYGRQVADWLASELAAAGAVIVSGFARGIDATAHQAALRAGKPTIAVLGNGVDVIYPAEHRRLYGQILEHGCLLSEYPPGTKPERYHFPERNRLISGLARGVIWVEGTERSGARLTVQHALEQNREVFAVPGRIDNPLSRGPHQWIREGCAKLVSSPEDILEEFPEFRAQRQRARPKVQLEPEEEELLRLLPEDPISLEELAERAPLSQDRLLTLLTQLELKGQIQRFPGGRIAKVLHV